MKRRDFVVGALASGAALALAPVTPAVTIEARPPLPLPKGLEYVGLVPNGLTIRNIRAYANGLLVLTDAGPYLWDGKNFDIVAAVKGDRAITVTEMYWTEDPA